MMENSKEAKEFTLITLVSVLVRYRRLILGGTLLASLIIIAGSCGLSKMGVLPPQAEFLYTVRIKELPSGISDKIYASFQIQSTKDLVFNKMTSIPWISKMFEVCPIDKIFEDKIENSAQIFIDSKRFLVEKSENCNDLSVKIVVKENYMSNVPAFMDSLKNELNSYCKSLYIPEINILKDNIDMAIEKIRNDVSTKTDMNVLQEQQRLSVIIDNYLKSDSDYVNFDNDPYVSFLKFSFLKKVIVTLFSAFFFFILVALFLDYINSVKSNDSQMQQLKDAWNRN